ncbi:hypothetical protein TP2_16345 [Thioclava pacifica DSM 10166]|uniref:Uncharacterized protein n=1 Tax=Thioclava pacifica DSM 10166 TaxID=1353537 RepID=A0A074JHV5_9RHOB|nr:hypothetical protein TP2_16345 [Thioclava pacifica DSM 10166]
MKSDTKPSAQIPAGNTFLSAAFGLLTRSLLSQPAVTMRYRGADLGDDKPWKVAEAPQMSQSVRTVA